METPWMDIAKEEIGVHEIESGDSSRIVEYHSVTSLHAMDDDTPWCAAFVCWVLHEAGYDHTHSAWAKNYLKYGDKCDPKYGAIMIFSRGHESGHVGFYVGEDYGTYHILGGNQKNSVCIANMPKTKFLGAR